MRVAIVTESFLPTINGVTNSVIQVNRTLVSQGHQVVILAPDVNSRPKFFEGSEVIGLPAINLQKVLPVAVPNFQIQRALLDFRPDVIHLASPAIMGAHAQRVASKLAIPTVAIYQTDYVGFAQHYKFSFAQRAIEKIVRVIHQSATINLAPSTFAIAQLDKAGVNNVARWGRGVDLEQFNPKHRRVDLFPRDKFVLGFVGRLAPEKGIERLAALDSRDDIQLVIIGDGPMRTELERKLPSAIFTGKKSGLELGQHFASLDAFIHPGEHETFCQAAQEALASAVPVIAPTRGGIKDFILDGVNGILVDFQDKSALANIPSSKWQFLSDPQTKDAARESVKDRSWESVNQELIGHYQSVVAQSRAKRVGLAS